jgi:HAE1 family hydrophobic/amphiphilic exporter-1
VVIAWRNGAPVRLQDVARVEDSVENDEARAELQGRRAITVSVQRQPDANTVSVTDAVRKLVPRFQAELPPTIQLRILSDRSESIRASVHDVQLTLILTAGLVILVILAFLRTWRATVIPAIALPLSIIGTFGGMAVLGFSLDNVTLLALTLALGFVVDDAIVVLENIVRYVEKGMKPFDAAIKGAQEISFTVLSITVSLVAVFIPILFMGGVVGRFFFSFAMTISIAILLSGFISLTLTPMLASRMPNPSRGRTGVAHSRPATRHRQGLQVTSLVTQGALADDHLTIATMWATVTMFGLVKTGFMPIEDTSILIVRTESAPDISFQAMVERQRRVAEIIREDPDVLYVNSNVAAGGFNPTINRGTVFTQLKSRPERERNATITEVQNRIRTKLAGVTGIRAFPQPLQNIRIGSRAGASAYQYTLSSVDQEQLYANATLLTDEVKRAPGFADVTTDLQLGARQVTMTIDRDALARYNVTNEAVRSTLYSAFGTRKIATVFTPSNDYAVILEADKLSLLDPGALSKIYVKSSNAQLVRLDTLATLSLGAGPIAVARQSQLPAVTITFNLAPGYTLGEAVTAMAGLERKINMPPTIVGQFAGTAQVFQDSFRDQPLLIAAAVITIYIVLGILYESFIHPITILSGLPTASLGRC